MESEGLAGLKALTDAELVSRLRGLTVAERTVTADVVAHLAEMETRDVHLKAGYPSLFVYCRDALGLSESEAYTRIDVARAVRRHPVILDLLVEGAVTLATVRILAPHLTAQNHREVLESARGKRKLQVEEIAARLSPRPDAPDLVSRLPSWGSSVPLAGGPMARSPMGAAPGATVAPLAPHRYRLQVTIGGDVLEKLRLARDMVRHVIPSGDDAAILDRALTALLAELARKRFAATPGPRGSTGAAPGSRHVPAEVKRAVWLRDLGRCAFVAEGGRRCGERAFVEFHHVKPYAAGGEATVENVQLRCRRHNGYEARAYFGASGLVPAAGRERPSPAPPASLTLPGPGGLGRTSREGS